jgi:hypothetical protein
MVFARKVKSKNKEYWILVHPIRKGKKITQKSRFFSDKEIERIEKRNLISRKNSKK